MSLMLFISLWFFAWAFVFIICACRAFSRAEQLTEEARQVLREATAESSNAKQLLERSLSSSSRNAQPASCGEHQEVICWSGGSEHIETKPDDEHDILSPYLFGDPVSAAVNMMWKKNKEKFEK